MPLFVLLPEINIFLLATTVIIKNFRKFIAQSLISLFLLTSQPAANAVEAQGYQASFRNTDIVEFINTVSQNLNKTIIIDPAVKGQVSVRSYETLNNEQYYQFFLSVLEVYGFAVVEGDKHLLKVVPARNALSPATPTARPDAVKSSDEVLTKMYKLEHSLAKNLAVQLRPVAESTGGAVIHAVSDDLLLMTGRAGVLERLTEIIQSVDKSEDQSVEHVRLGHASASQVVETLNNLIAGGKSGVSQNPQTKLVADDRTNSLLITGDASSRKKLRALASSLDEVKPSHPAARVIYLQHAKAKNLLDVLTGIGNKSLQEGEGTVPSVSVMKDVVIKADEHTNSLIISAPQEAMDELEAVIARLDISRAQVLVEAIIVEIQDAKGLALGVQWFNQRHGGTQFPESGSAVSQFPTGDTSDVLKNLSGLAAGFYQGEWSGLFTALQNDSLNNILATPSIVTLDNMEAEFTVGKDVPILTGSQASQTGDNIYNTVARKSVGIKLKVKPQINEGNTVLMEVEQEVSSVAEDSTKDNLGASFNTRTVKNAVLVNSGNTVVVGGLLDNTTTELKSSVPLLGDIPWIGSLFRYSSEKASKRNLMLFLRPTIIRDGGRFNAVTSTQTGRYHNIVGNQPGNEKMLTALDQQLAAADDDVNALEATIRDISAFYEGKPL
ncbi:general secretion pathway protein D [Pantoea sp. SORGH_AS 659]|nr:type II secretion system secretin GspD [Pantoea sp. SORGH_AS_0659]MDR6352483.1 general secretion pathway protein D [Pantoea sp. SORGH_AS_0659]